MKSKTCETCRFYSALPSWPHRDKGKCHATPPTPKNASLAFFPVVNSSEWCGSWKRAR